MYVLRHEMKEERREGEAQKQQHKTRHHHATPRHDQEESRVEGKGEGSYFYYDVVE